MGPGQTSRQLSRPIEQTTSINVCTASPSMLLTPFVLLQTHKYARFTPFWTKIRGLQLLIAVYRGICFKPPRLSKQSVGIAKLPRPHVSHLPRCAPHQNYASHQELDVGIELFVRSYSLCSASQSPRCANSTVIILLCSRDPAGNDAQPATQPLRPVGELARQRMKRNVLMF
jgi:hypothetical protein